MTPGQLNNHRIWQYYVLAAFSFACVLSVSPTVACAASSLGTLSKTWSTEAVSIGSVLPTIAAVIGIGLGISGLLKVVQSKQTHQPAGPGWWMIGIGAGLCSVPFWLGSFSATMGADASGLSKLGL